MSYTTITTLFVCLFFFFFTINDFCLCMCVYEINDQIILNIWYEVPFICKVLNPLHCPIIDWAIQQKSTEININNRPLRELNKLEFIQMQERELIS